MTLVATVIAAIDPSVWPFLFGVRYRTMTCRMATEINLVLWVGHKRAARGFVVNFVIAVGLGILINDECRHFSTHIVGWNWALDQGKSAVRVFRSDSTLLLPFKL